MKPSLYPIPVGPSNAELVTGFISRCKKQGFDFCPSDPTAFDPYSLFVYHIPKTGGMRLVLPIALSVDGIARNSSHPWIQSLLNCEISPSSLSCHSRGDQDIEEAADWHGFTFFSDHQVAYGEHFRLLDPAGKFPCSASILRNPHARLTSAIKYLWRINGQDKKRTLDAISSGHAHINNPLTRIFSGKLNLSECLSDFDDEKALLALRSINILLHQENFSQIRRLQQEFISRNRLPNIICNSFINKTPVDPPSDVLEELVSEAYCKGALHHDLIVYNAISTTHPIVRDQAKYSINSLHPLTFICNLRTESQSATFIDSEPKIVNTIDLLLDKVNLADIVL